MKPLAVGIILLGIFIISWVVTFIALFVNLGGDVDIREADIIHGKAEVVIWSHSFWKIYPSIPPNLSSLLQVKSLILMVFLAASGLLFFRRCLKRSYLAVSIFCLGSGIIPYLIGRVALWEWSKDTSHVGSWLAFMVLGILYGGGFCIFFAVLYLWKGNTPVGQDSRRDGEFTCLPNVE